MIRNIWQPFYTAYVLITFLVCLLLAFPVFLLVGLRDSPTARLVIWAIVKYWSRTWLFIIGMPMRLIGSKPDTNKYIVVANHISYLDTITIYASVPDYFRALAKKEMVKVPVFGFVYKQLTILVDRSNAHNRARSMRLMWRLLKNECNVVIFPEGTFNETGQPLKAFYDGAFKLAISAQVPIFPIIYPDTVHRWHYSAWWKLSPGRNRAVYLQPVPTEGMSMADLPALKQQVYIAMEQAMIQYSKP